MVRFLTEFWAGLTTPSLAYTMGQGAAIVLGALVAVVVLYLCFLPLGQLWQYRQAKAWEARQARFGFAAMEKRRARWGTDA